jgi:hypothetical protein
LRLDPGSPERWTDMAEAMYETGRAEDARYCVEQAMRRSPGLPNIAMRGAGMYFRLGDPVAALRLTNRVAGETREYDANVFQVWQRLGGTAEQVYSWGVGNNVQAGRGYFRFLAAAGDMDATGAAWKAMQGRQMAGEVESRDYAEALTTAHDYEPAAVIESEILPDGVTNSGFENDWNDEPLNWRADSVPGITVSRDTSVRYQGKASLRLEFDDSNRNEFNRVAQTRALPGGAWLLRAMLRAELTNKAGGVDGMTSAPGVGLRVVDAEDGKTLGVTSLLNATHDWMPVEARVTVGPRARPVRIEIVRPATPESALTMTGTAWIDNVTLTPGGPK